MQGLQGKDGLLKAATVQRLHQGVDDKGERGPSTLAAGDLSLFLDWKSCILTMARTGP
jgi:hypothetical protein